MTRSRRAMSIAGRLRLPPAWTLLLALGCDAAFAVWRLTSHGAGTEIAVLLDNLVWPGGGVLIAVYLFAWLGWALDID